jgi:molybdenum cofactor cytidylyltransferase
VVLLNQADTVELQAQAIDLSGMLLEKFDAVLIASLQAGVSTAVVPGIESLSGEVYAVHQRIGGVILAAGGARRYGEPKILLPWKGEAIIRHVAKTALAAGLNTVVVVVGDQIADIHEAVADLDVKLVHNSAWESGQSSSVKAGLQELPTNVGGAVFLLGDQPKIPPALVRALVEKHAASLSPIVAPLVDGQRGNPVLFDQETFPEFMAISGDVGGRALFARFPVEWVPWHDADVLLDIDSPQDYLRLQDKK